MKQNQILTANFNKTYRDKGFINYKITESFDNDDLVLSHTFSISNPKNETQLKKIISCQMELNSQTMLPGIH